MNDKKESRLAGQPCSKKKPGEVCVRWVDFSKQGHPRVRRWRYAKPLNSEQKRAA